MGKNFVIKSIDQNFVGKHFITAMSDDGDIFTLTTLEKEDLAVGHVVDIWLSNLSTHVPLQSFTQVSPSPGAVAQAAEQGQPSAGSTDATPAPEAPKDLSAT